MCPVMNPKRSHQVDMFMSRTSVLFLLRNLFEKPHLFMEARKTATSFFTPGNLIYEILSIVVDEEYFQAAASWDLTPSVN